MTPPRAITRGGRGARAGRRGLLGGRAWRRLGRVRCIPVVLHAAVKSRPMDAGQFRRLSEVALRDHEGRLDVAALPLGERLIEIEALLDLQMAPGRFQHRLEVLADG